MNVTEEVSEAKGLVNKSNFSIFRSTTMLSSVLVAHNGDGFDFPVLLAEMERRPKLMAVTDLVRHNIHFTDTLSTLKQVRDN